MSCVSLMFLVVIVMNVVHEKLNNSHHSPTSHAHTHAHTHTHKSETDKEVKEIASSFIHNTVMII